MEFSLTSPAMPHSMEVVEVVAPNRVLEGMAGRVEVVTGTTIVHILPQHQVQQTQAVVVEAAILIRLLIGIVMEGQAAPASSSSATSPPPATTKAAPRTTTTTGRTAPRARIDRRGCPTPLASAYAGKLLPGLTAACTRARRALRVRPGPQVTPSRVATRRRAHLDRRHRRRRRHRRHRRPTPHKTRRWRLRRRATTILADIADARLKAKVRLLADAAIAGVKVQRLTAKLSAADEETACSTAFTKAEMSASDGTCMAAASSGKRRLSATTYDVEIIFSSAVVSDGALTKAADALKANGVEGVTSKTSMDPIAELKVIPASTRASFKRLTEAGCCGGGSVGVCATSPAPSAPEPTAAESGTGRRRPRTHSPEHLPRTHDHRPKLSVANMYGKTRRLHDPLLRVEGREPLLTSLATSPSGKPSTVTARLVPTWPSSGSMSSTRTSTIRPSVSFPSPRAPA